MWILVAVLVAVLAFVALYSASVCEAKWFKIFINVLFSAIVSLLVTANLYFR